MQVLARLLSLAILVLAMLYGALLFTDVRTFNSPRQRHTVDQRESKTTLPSLILSRLNLIPFFSGRQPLFAVVIENHEDARPYQRGLSSAVLIQEYMVEGFISRFVALFDERSIPKSIGPVRSLRPYFIDGTMPWGGTVFHAGGSPEAFERAREQEGIQAINGLALPEDFLRDDDIPPPHNLFVPRDRLRHLLEMNRVEKDVTWPPFPVGSPVGASSVTDISVNFFSSLHNISYAFDAFTGTYKRTNGKTVSDAHPHNILFLEVPIDSIGEHGRMFMTLTGKGDALLFHSGKMQEGEWHRKSLDESWTFTTADGEDFLFAKGQIWMTVLPDLERVKWE
ncbi:DUF3048 domain-containing protein [Candidatus Peregrinibacteria bacterium]|nr:DUF3048 domain-containing protein [Candidatus Peregrinibacteria bacterium]